MSTSIAKPASPYALVVPTGVVLFVGYFVWFTGVRNEINSDVSLFAILFTIQLLPMCICLLRKEVDYLAIVFTNYTFSLTYTKYIEFSSAGVLSFDAHHELEQLVLCNLLTLVAFYSIRVFLMGNISLAARTREPEINRSQLVVMILLFAFTKIGIAIGYAGAGRIMSGIVTIVSVLLLCARTENNPQLGVVAKAIVLGSALLAAINSGMLGELISAVLTTITILLVTKRWKLLLILLPLLGIGMVFQTIKYAYRSFVWQEDTTTVVERLEIVSELITGLYFGDTTVRPEILEAVRTIQEGVMLVNTPGFAEEIEEMVEAKEAISGEPSTASLLLASRSRVSDDSLMRVLKMTPNEVPYFEGSTYMNILYTFIPRIVWPSKPNWNVGSEFGHAYEVLSPEDETTSIAFSYLAEGYMNFGYIGLYTVAILMGVWIAFVERVTLVRSNRYALAAYAIFAVPITMYQTEALSIVQSFFIDGTIFTILTFSLNRIGFGPTHHS